MKGYRLINKNQDFSDMILSSSLTTCFLPLLISMRLIAADLTVLGKYTFTWFKILKVRKGTTESLLKL